jgi:4-hydroxythreonine-4-phosphate dehydrogenase
MSLPVIAVTMGDPAGVGPEVIVKALADPEVAALASWISLGDPEVLAEAERLTGLKLPEVRVVKPQRPLPGGRGSVSGGRVEVACIREAVRMCLAGEAAAMVTAPVNKEAINQSGEPFTGHTELIAEMCGAADPRMMLASDRLRVIHVTTHIPLREACRLDTSRIIRTIELGHDAMRRLGFNEPRIAVCGLNPHAGEHGLFGDEEERVIAPAIAQARAQGIGCEGPLPPDTVFWKALRGGYDLVVALYHDQGHIPMKLVAFEHAVNVTLGLPIIRTSVDHGTAYDIAGRGVADPGSMKAAMKMAAQMTAG